MEEDNKFMCEKLTGIPVIACVGENDTDNTKYMIEAILKAGKVPVLPMIPSSTNPDVGNNTDYYNAIVTKLYDE